MQKNILITGGAGFIGSHVVRLMVTKYPDYQIFNLDALTYAGNLENLKDIENLQVVDKCILSIDKDRTVVETIKMVFNQFGKEYQLSFANGGDQNNDTIPEKPICKILGIELIDGLGGKIQSSSWLLKQ